VRAGLFADWKSTLATALIALLAAYTLPTVLQWAVFNAVFAPDANACQTARGTGACWGVIVEKWRLIIFGRYPFDAHWRPEVATLLLLGLVAMSCVRAFWKKWLAILWLVVVPAFFLLMSGGPLGLAKVPTDQWGGLPLTVMIATFSILVAFPLSILVALGRRSHLPAIRTLCVVYVELIRGVPLVSLLFMASFLFPLFLPVGKSPDVLLRVMVAMTLFAAAYLAETVRGGLQAMFKDTSLVTIVSLYELTGALNIALNSDANWRPFKIEGYIFIAVIYFAFCFAMSRYSLWIEARLGESRNR